MTDRDLDTELDRVLARIEPHEPGAGLVARILADAPKPRRASLLDKVRAVLTPQGQRWPAGAALASLADGLSTGYAAAAQGTVDDPLADMVAYEALGLETFSFVSETDGP